MAKVNKLNIYLIKHGKELEQIFKDPLDSIETISLDDGSSLYYNRKTVVVPEWVSKFFKTNFKDSDNRDIFNASSSQAILIKNIRYNESLRLNFAISFGTGYHMLNNDAIVPNFGLRTVLNVISPDYMRKIDKRNISSTPKHTSEQLSKVGSQVDFDIDFDTDVLTGVVGSFKKNRKDIVEKKYEKRFKMFGTTISGKSSLNINAPFDIENIDKLLRFSYAAYSAKKYLKNGFDWIDNVYLINAESQLYTDLCTQLDFILENIEGDTEKIWIAVPEAIEWNNISGFCYKKTRDRYPDLFFEDLLKYKEEDEIISTSFLKSFNISARNADNTKDQYSWNAFQCLYAEIDYQGKKYMLINSDWYEINNDFVRKINNKYDSIKTKETDVTFIDAEDTDVKENDYNRRLTQHIPHSLCLDAKNILHGGKYSKVEFCDVFDIDKNALIHIKKYSGSSVLSHLFSQGAVSADLLLRDDDFKSKVEEKIQKSISDFSFKDDQVYNIVFGIIAKPQQDSVDLPFFSKVTLVNAVQKLNGMKRVDAFIKIIPNHALKSKKEDDDNNE